MAAVTHHLASLLLLLLLLFSVVEIMITVHQTVQSVLLSLKI